MVIDPQVLIQEIDVRGLVLRSAVGPEKDAQACWREATSLQAIDDWPNELVRPLPHIYSRLRSDANAPHLSLLRGISRATWATNLLRMQRALPILARLTEAKIPYRLIKGAAVCSLLNSWGSRRMGDVDLVVPLDVAKEVRAILRAHGFRERVPESFPSGIWEDGEKGFLDVHWASPDDEYLQAILRDAGTHAQVLDHQVRIPTPEAMTAIAVHHAKSGLATSDYIQGLIDVDQLLSRCDVTALRTSLAALETWEFAIDMLQELRALESVALSGFPTLGPAPRQMRSAVRPLKNTVHSLRRVTRILARRSISPIHLLRCVPGLWRHPSYLAWLSSGQLRPIESVCARRWNGFLPSPQVPILPNQSIRISMKPGFLNNQNITAVRVPGVEDRWKIQIVPQTRIRIELSVAQRERVVPQMLFVNGQLHGFFPPEGALTARLELRTPAKFLEFSLRLIPTSGNTGAPIELSIRESIG